MSTVVARTVTRAVAPLMLLVSINFFLQGHNLPGGGFIAGVMSAAAFALVYIIFNFDGLRELFKIEDSRYSMIRKYVPVSGFGLMIGAGTGVLTIALGRNFMDHFMGNIHIGHVFKYHWTTAMLFDLGVYLTVTGSLLIVIEVIGEE